MFTRAPIGLSSTGDKYKLFMHAAFDGIKKTKKLIDDILKYDDTFKVHVEKIRELLERCRSHGISISKKKFIFSKPRAK